MDDKAKKSADFILGSKAADLWLYTCDACANEKVIPKKYRYTTGTGLMNAAEEICDLIESANLLDLREYPRERLGMQPWPAQKSAGRRCASQRRSPGKSKGEQNAMGQLISNLASGSLVKLAEHTKPTKFIKLDNDHYGTGTGVTLIRKDTFTARQWEASCDGDRNCKNRYIGCLLDNFCDLMWPQMLDPEIKDCLVPVPIVVAEGNGVATLHTIYRVGFALSCTEAGVSGWKTEGTAFSYFNSNARRIAYFDETTTAVRWGLRSPYSGFDDAYHVDTDGSVDLVTYVYWPYFAPRPAFNLKSSIVVSDTTDSDGCYTIESVPGKSGGLYVKNNGVWVQAA